MKIKNNPVHKIRMLDALTLVALPLIVFFVVPITVIANNLEELGNLDGAAAIYCFLSIALVLILIPLMIAWIGNGTWLVRAMIWASGIAFFFLFLTGLLLPLTGTAGQVEVSQIPINWPNFAIVSALTGLFLLLRHERLKKIVLVTMLVFVLTTAATSSFRVLAHRQNTPFERLTTASSTNNIFVLSFDGLGRDVTLEAVKESDQFSHDLKDFILFDHVISTAPSTQASLTSEMMGGIDLKTLYGTEEAMGAKLDRSKSIASYLQRDGFDISIYGPYSFVFSDHDKIVFPGTIKQSTLSEDQFASVFRLSMARMITPVLAYGYNTVRTICGRLLDLWSDEREMAADQLVVRTLNHQGATWDIPNITNVREYYAYVHGLRIGTSRPVAQFMHFLHTHYPVDFDESCNYRSDDVGWFNDNQNRRGVKAETKCALTQFNLFLEKLKSLGIYDRSTIILKSDHGQPTAYTDPNRMESFSLRGHPVWGYARHTPWLAIKPLGRRQNAPVLDSRPAVLSDLARTVCHLADPAGQCIDFEGFDLLSSKPIPADARYFVNLITGPNSTYEMNTHQSVSILRREPFFQTLTDMFTSEMLDTPPLCGMNIDLTKGVPFNNGLIAFRQCASWRDTESTSLKCVTPECSPSTGRVTFRLQSGNQNEEPILVNFVIARKIVATRLVRHEELNLPLSVDVPLPTIALKNQTLTMTAGAPGSTVTLQGIDLLTAAGVTVDPVDPRGQMENPG